MNCPKCDFAVSSVLRDDLYITDIAHAGEDWHLARDKIDTALDQALLNRHKGFKIIHGHGNDSGHSAIIRINAVPYLKALAKRHGGRLVQDRFNPGAHIIYF
ncbi:MAG: hypothetical protein H8E20_03975 [Verrucomicrobia bacterium]|nr:hypothetical protein [Verrucomicrobiota bacterium]